MFNLTEQDLESYLTKKLNIIDPSLKLIGRQYQTKYGKIDLFCKDQKNYVVIEIKNKADTNSPGQLAKYVFSIKKTYSTPYVKGILVSRVINTEVAELCDYFNLDFRELTEIDLPEYVYDPKAIDVESLRLTLTQQRILRSLYLLHKENEKDAISLKELGEYLYPEKKWSQIKTTLSEYSSILQDKGLIYKELRGTKAYLTLKAIRIKHLINS